MFQSFKMRSELEVLTQLAKQFYFIAQKQYRLTVPTYMGPLSFGLILMLFFLINFENYGAICEIAGIGITLTVVN